MSNETLTESCDRLADMATFAHILDSDFDAYLVFNILSNVRELKVRQPHHPIVLGVEAALELPKTDQLDLPLTRKP